MANVPQNLLALLLAGRERFGTVVFQSSLKTKSPRNKALTRAVTRVDL